MTDISKLLYSIKINIFNFFDYHDYLTSLIHQLRAADAKLTYRQLSAAFGFKSPNFLLLLSQKKRKLSIESAQKISKVIEHSKIENEYFILMVQSGLVTEILEKEKLSKRMIQIQKTRKQNVIEPKMYELYENWYQVILREILNLPHISQNANFLSNLFIEKISESQIIKALQKLESLGLINKQNNKWVNQQVNLKTGDFVSNTAILAFHKKMLSLANKSLDQFSGKERYLSALTLPISEASHIKIRELIEEFKTKALEISEEQNDSDRVMQLNLQFFPITKVTHEKK